MCLFQYINYAMGGASLVDHWVKYLPAKQETQVTSLGWEDTLEKKPGKSYGQRILAGYIPWGLKLSDTTYWLNLTHTMLCVRSCQLIKWVKSYKSSPLHGFYIVTIDLTKKEGDRLKNCLQSYQLQIGVCGGHLSFTLQGSNHTLLHSTHSTWSSGWSVRHSILRGKLRIGFQMVRYSQELILWVKFSPYLEKH